MYCIDLNILEFTLTLQGLINVTCIPVGMNHSSQDRQCLKISKDIHELNHFKMNKHFL